MEGRGKLRNLNNFAMVSRGILRTGPLNLAKFLAENWALVITHGSRYGYVGCGLLGCDMNHHVFIT